MPLAPGRTLGPYEILSPLGAGGMGEVYEAKDTRLGRTVAIKVLPEGLAENPERRARFEREARTVSQLTHPHVCTLYDVGEEEGLHFLVMEHLEGETLAERLDRGALPLEETLRYGAQIGEALHAAHRRGVIHRDLKPANVMLTKDGVKLLDFGLARMAAGAGEAVADLPTMTMREEGALTDEGTVLGTFPYMSPEQVEGGQADARSDIFALGAVLYEMTTGRRAFTGESAASVMASILRAEPEPLSQVEPVSPPIFDHLVSRCLAKDPEERWQSAKDVAAELRWIAGAGSRAGVATPLAGHRESRERLAWMLSATASLLALAFGLWAWSLQGPSSPQLTYLSINIPAGADAVSGPALSPDGRRVAYGLWQGDEAALYVRSLDQQGAVRVPGAENPRDVLFSPDGRWLAYYDTESAELRKIPVSGGSPFTICEAQDFWGGDWREDGTIVFSMGPPLGLWTVSASGGDPQPLTETKSSPGGAREDAHHSPRFLPGGQAVLFTVWSPGTDPEARVAIAELETGRIRTLFEGASAVYSASGHLLYRRPQDRTLVAVPFDLAEERVVGDPTVIASPVDGLSLSQSGALAYEEVKEMPLRLVWLELDGSTHPLPVPGRHYGQISIGPDGRRAAVVIEDPHSAYRQQVWLIDLERGTSTPITTYRGWNNYPLWTPDGDSIVFASDREGPPTLYRVSVEGGEPQRLITDDLAFRPDSFAPDGRRLVFTHIDLEAGEQSDTATSKSDLRMLDLDSGEVAPLLETAAGEHSGRISPDGRWLGYVSDESGDDQVYLRSFPDLGGKRRVSLGGVTGRLHWGAEGRKLFYRQGEEVRSRLMAVEIRAEPELTIGEPRVVVPIPPEMEGADLAPGEERILAAESTGETEREIVVILGWGQWMEER